MSFIFDLALAFGGGVLAFFSPCFLPLVPAYLIYITGLSFEQIQKVRIETILHSLLFILGFTVVFTFLGAGAGLLGELLYMFRDVMRVLGGCLVIFMGLYLMGILKLPFLNIERRITLASKPSGYVGTILVGMTFAFAWIPCIGPILGGILLYASQSETLGMGILMLMAFSLGLGVPLFLFSLAINFLLSFIKRISEYLGIIHVVSGMFLVIVGLLLVFDYIRMTATWIINLTGYHGI